MGEKIFQDNRILVESDGSGEEIQIFLNGEINIYTVVILKDILLKEIRGNRFLSFNLSRVSEIDTSGFQLLTALKKESQRLKHSLYFRDHSSEVLSILDVYGAVGLWGDKIKIPASERSKYAFKYGLKRQKFA